MVIMVMVVDDNAGEKGSDDGSGVADEGVTAMVMLTAMMLMLVVMMVVLTAMVTMMVLILVVMMTIHIGRE